MHPGMEYKPSVNLGRLRRVKAKLASEGVAKCRLVGVARRFRVQPEGGASFRRGKAEPAAVRDGTGPHRLGEELHHDFRLDFRLRTPAAVATRKKPQASGSCSTRSRFR